MKNVFLLHKSRYGKRRISDELKDSGIMVGVFLARRMMHEQGLAAKYPKPFKPRTTDSRHNKQASPNLLKELENRMFGAEN